VRQGLQRHIREGKSHAKNLNSAFAATFASIGWRLREQFPGLRRKFLGGGRGRSRPVPRSKQNCERDDE
jgi:hypothetical protein